jgi:dTDP-4-amino-4,6-dideoxygalactose transaminase
MSAFLPYGRQSIDDDDVAAVAAALRADMLTTGPLVEVFERDFARAAGARHAVACNSGTAALASRGTGARSRARRRGDRAERHLPRDRQRRPLYRRRSRVRRRRCRYRPADAGDARSRDRARGGHRLRAVFPVHLNGQLCDMPAIEAIARRHGLAIVEDACHALGLPDVGAARHGGMACFSTHPVKAIATGEGGVVTTANADTAARLRRMRSHGMVREPPPSRIATSAFDGDTPNPWYYEMPEPGWNYRLPDVLCALGISQLRKLERFFARRQADRGALRRAARTARARAAAGPAQAAAWLASLRVLVDFAALGTTRAQFMSALRAQASARRSITCPSITSPTTVAATARSPCQGADAYYARCLSIPFYPALGDDDVARVADALARSTGRA